MKDAVELEILIPLQSLLGQLAGLAEHVLVERLQLLKRQGIVRRVKAMQVAEQEAEGVAQLAVDLLGKPLEQRDAGDDVFAEVDRSDPEADNLRAKLIGNFSRRNVGAARF